MALSVYELALIAGGFGIAGTLLGVLAAYRLSMKLADRQLMHMREISKLDAWHAAAHEFVSAFSKDLATLESGASLGQDLSDFLRAAYDARHVQAIALQEVPHLIADRARIVNHQNLCHSNSPKIISVKTFPIRHCAALAGGR